MGPLGSGSGPGQSGRAQCPVNQPEKLPGAVIGPRSAAGHLQGQSTADLPARESSFVSQCEKFAVPEKPRFGSYAPRVKQLRRPGSALRLARLRKRLPRPSGGSSGS